MERRKKLKTLSYHNDVITIVDPKESPFSEILNNSFDLTYNYEELANKMLRNKIRQSKFPTWEDFNRITETLKQIKLEIKERNNLQSGYIQLIKIEVLKEFTNIEEIKEVYLHLEDRTITFFIVLDCYSKQLLHNIFDIKIMISRKYSEISIDFEPTLNRDSILEGSILIVNRK